MVDKINLGSEIQLLEVARKVSDGYTVAVLCDCRKDVKRYMEMFGKQLYGRDFIKNYSECTISYNNGAILFFLNDDSCRYKGIAADFHMMVRK